MDELDKKILASLQTNNRVSTEALGAQIGLSATACQRRIKKLRRSGIVKKEIAVLDGIILGSYVTVIVDITLKEGGFYSIDEIRTQMLLDPCVQQCYYVAGDSDFVLIVTAPNMLAYEQLTRRLFFDNQNIQKFTSKVVMENVKVGLNIPLQIP